MKDHLVFGQVVVPGAMFATMAATVLWGERAGSVVLDDCQSHSPMIVPRDDAREEAGEGGRKLQIVFDGSDGNSLRRFEVFSRGGEDVWTLHLDGRMSRGGLDLHPILLDGCFQTVLATRQSAMSMAYPLWTVCSATPKRRTMTSGRVPAVYVLQCALTAFWSGLGIGPSAVVGTDIGELAAAEAAGVIGLEDGLRLAVAHARGTSAGEALNDMTPAPPPLDRFARTLSDRGIGAIVEIGPGASLGEGIACAWPDESGNGGRPSVLETLRHAPDADGFLEAAVQAWEAGLPVSFAGLFGGETRRRIPLPCYPLERRRYWMDDSRK